MAYCNDLINFDLIETHKENIQSLPGGRSARQLASIFTPLPSGNATGTPTLDETKTLNDAIRQEYEIELQSVADSDDPLDIYDRYVKWTLNAYPSAQATPQSQLLPLLERATKAFLTSSHYKNDPRYLKLWLHYIRFFSDAPRETFAFLARHNIGEGLGLFYEEFAVWLEGAGRWNQAEEVYKMGIEREARPAERLMRKYNEFVKRMEATPHSSDEPSSPALPTVRPALAAKVDPFASSSRTEDSQLARGTTTSGAGIIARSGKPKMAIFSDTDVAVSVPAANATKGWDNIGSTKDRKKENTIEARPWVGETLKAGKKVGAGPRMEIFKDPHCSDKESKSYQIPKSTTDVTKQSSGRVEKVFAIIDSIYPNDHEEYSFEELRAKSRGWSQHDWSRKPTRHLTITSGNVQKSPESVDIENLSDRFREKVDIHDESAQSMPGIPETKHAKHKRPKIREVRQEVQTVKTRLESPTGPKIRRKGSSEPTMTFHSKAATNEFYDMFNQPLRSQHKDDTQSGEDTDLGDDTYSTTGDSTGTGRISATNSEFGEDTLASLSAVQGENTESQPDSISPWSEFTASKHVPKISSKAGSKVDHRHISSEDITENMTSSQNQTQSSGVVGAFDTQAIADIANQDFGDLDTKMIASLAGNDVDIEDDVEDEDDEDEVSDKREELQTPIEESMLGYDEVSNNTKYIPLPPEDYEPTPIRPYRDPAETAQNKLPFMTPIVERTESSLAPSTIFDDNYYVGSKTPSRIAHTSRGKDDSPSKLKADTLLLISPEKANPFSAKRKLGRIHPTEEENLISSPQKKPVPKSPPKQGPEISFSPTKPVEECTSNDNDLHIREPKHHVTAQQIISPPLHKGVIVTDLQCNPCDSTIREQILGAMDPSLHSYPGYQDQSNQNFSFYGTLKTYAEKIAKQRNNTKASPRKSQNEKALTKVVSPILKLTGSSRVYAVKRELGRGAFAPVYLVDSYDPEDDEDQVGNIDLGKSNGFTDSRLSCLPSRDDGGRHELEALKIESPPGTLVWEFHILRLLKDRLESTSRTIKSIITAHECHLYRDEAYLILNYSPQGTLLDLVNLARGDSVRAGKPAEGLDEVLAMWFSVELIRALAAIHQVGIMHGDLKADNCLVRFDTSIELTSPYDADGEFGWSHKGLKLIDFGRGIDVYDFDPRVKFVADWEASPQDCAEIRECRPWTWQIDYHGAAGVMHSLLFGKYIETVPASISSSNDPSNSDFDESIGQKKEWKLKESFKRYWERDLWNEIFSLLLNPTSAAIRLDTEEAEQMPIHRNLERIRVKMEDWLVREGERGNRDLRTAIRKAERTVGEAGKSRK